VEFLHLSNPSNPIWALQLPAGVMLVLASDALVRSVYVRVIAGGASGVLAMLFIVSVILYRLAPSSIKNLGKGLWFVGAISVNVTLFAMEPVIKYMKELFIDPTLPFPQLTIPGWGLAVSLIMAFISGATVVKRYTEDVNVQQGVAWVVRCLGIGIILTGIQHEYLGVAIVLVLVLPYVLPRFLWVPLYSVIFSPLLLLWWVIKVAFKEMFGWEVQYPDEVFFTGRPLAEHAAASPAPKLRSRMYLSSYQAEQQAEVVTHQHYNKMLEDVKTGTVEVPTWEVKNGRFVRTPSKSRDDVHNLSTRAQQRLKRAMAEDF